VGGLRSLTVGLNVETPLLRERGFAIPRELSVLTIEPSVLTVEPSLFDR